MEKAEHAMRFFNVVPEFLSTIDLSHVTWAQYIDVVDGNGNTLVGADKMGLLDGSTGKRKAIFNAFKLYGWMPLQRASVSTNTSLQGLASKDDNCVCVVLWNNSPRTMPISLSLIEPSLRCCPLSDTRPRAHPLLRPQSPQSLSFS